MRRLATRDHAVHARSTAVRRRGGSELVLTVSRSHSARSPPLSRSSLVESHDRAMQLQVKVQNFKNFKLPKRRALPPPSIDSFPSRRVADDGRLDSGARERTVIASSSKRARSISKERPLEPTHASARPRILARDPRTARTEAW